MRWAFVIAFIRKSFQVNQIWFSQKNARLSLFMDASGTGINAKEGVGCQRQIEIIGETNSKEI